MRNKSGKLSLTAWLKGVGILACAVAMAMAVQSCSDDGAVTPAPPAVELSSASYSGLVGSAADMTVSITAPGGAKKLTILKNGGAFDTEDFSGETSTDFDFEYDVESLAVGTVTNFTFQVTDNADQNSNLASYSVTVATKNTITKTGVISASEHWTADNIYKLSSYVRIGDDATRGGGATTITGVVLTIDPGTLIIGTRSNKATLVVQRGNKIIADGTAENPIVFTSERPVGSRLPGDWGGVVIVGKATNNQGANVELEGGYGAFHGGSTDDDNSGILRYVRIEYAGVPINPNQEVNSLTMGSVGSGTILSYIQCSVGLDDSFEWFGGTVNADHLIAYKGFDDDFDVDFGYSGHVQFAIGIREPSSADQSGSNGFEVDNDGSGSSNTPFTSATFSNVSIIGPKATNETAVDLQFQNAAHLRRNNKLKIHNSVFTGYPNGIFIDASQGTPGAAANALAGDLVLKNNVLAGVDGWGGNGFGSATNADETTNIIATGFPFGSNVNHPTSPRGFWMAASPNIGADSPLVWFKATNEVYTKWTDIKLNANIFAANFGSDTPTLLPDAGSVLLSGADFTGLTGFTTVVYKGAFGTSDWTTGWANWNPQVTVY